MTDRLLAAISNPYVRVIGHPTGRMLMHRDGYPYDFERVAADAARHNVALELNSSPERLDLNDVLLRAAKAKGCRFVVSTDAHHPKHLLNMQCRFLRGDGCADREASGVYFWPELGCQ